MPSSSSQRIYLAFILEDYALGSPGPFSQRGGRMFGIVAEWIGGTFSSEPQRSV
jgi:hypothetical protein